MAVSLTLCAHPFITFKGLLSKIGAILPNKEFVYAFIVAPVFARRFNGLTAPGALPFNSLPIWYVSHTRRLVDQY